MSSKSTIEKSVLFLRSTDPRYDSRVLRSMETLVSDDLRISGVFWSRDGDRSISIPGVLESTNFEKIADFGSGIGNLYNQILWQLFQAKALIRTSACVVYACDLDTYLVALALKLFKGYKIVFDQFDPYESRFKSKWLRFLVRRIETHLIQFADVYVVPKIERAMRDHYRRVVFPNMPSAKSFEPDYTYPSPYLFYGGVLSSDRGLFTAIESIRKKGNWKFLIAGFGELEREIKELALPNVIFLGKKSPDQIISLSAGASAILGTYDTSISQNQNSASNKVAESAHVRVPIIVSYGCTQELEVKSYQLGFVVNYGAQNEIDEVLQKLEESPWKPKSGLNESFLSEFGWEDSRKSLYDLVWEVASSEKN